MRKSNQHSETYSHADITAVTGGAVNQGLLHSWIKAGHLQPVGRASSIRGAPLIFTTPTVLKAALMSELRRGGSAVADAADWAAICVDEMMALVAGRKVTERNTAVFLAVPLDGSGIRPVTMESAVKLSLSDWRDEIGDSFVLIDVLGVYKRVIRGLAERKDGVPDDAEYSWSNA